MNSIDDVLVDEESTTTTTTSTSNIDSEQQKKDTLNGSMLKFAAEANDIEEVKRLIEVVKVSPNQKDSFGDLPLHGAIVKKRVNIVKYLLEKGADPNATNQVGSTSLHKLVTIDSLKDQFDIIGLLMKAGADPTIKNGAGLLPEQLVAFSKIKEVLQGDQAVTVKISVPKSDHGKIIGRDGKKLNELRELTNTMITVPDLKEISNKVITIKGRSDDVENARQRILDMVKPEEFVGDVLTLRDIPKESHRLLIGAGGATIKRLREEYNVQITIPPPDSQSKEVIIRGELDNIDNAMKEINKIIKSVKNKQQGNNNNNSNNNNSRSSNGGGNRGENKPRPSGGGGGGSGGPSKPRATPKPTPKPSV